MAEEEEVLIEVEAVQAVYGDDCVVLDSFPPHLHVHIKPRTADVSSQQFVEAVVEIRAGPQYPEEPPHIYIIESKGLDEQRQKHLVTTIQDKARELSSYLMLVALCEEAVEKLTVMNHPDGNCPLCLYPLVPEGELNESLPFMKLMSCFHCFHSECIMRWWNWIDNGKESNTNTSSTTTLLPVRETENPDDLCGVIEEGMGNCPVCRKVFHARDFEHVLDLVGSHSSQLTSNGAEDDNDEELLHSDSENVRRQKFEAILKLQQENSGLIEPKRNLAVLPGMYLPQAAAAPIHTLNEETTQQQHRDPTVSIESNSCGSSSRPSSIEQPQRDPTVHTGTNSYGSSNRPSTTDHRNPGRRRQRVQYSRKPVKQWVRRENGTNN